jgi:hypothetical protein
MGTFRQGVSAAFYPSHERCPPPMQPGHGPAPDRRRGCDALALDDLHKLFLERHTLAADQKTEPTVKCTAITFCAILSGSGFGEQWMVGGSEDLAC